MAAATFVHLMRKRGKESHMGAVAQGIGSTGMQQNLSPLAVLTGWPLVALSGPLCRDCSQGWP